MLVPSAIATRWCSGRTTPEKQLSRGLRNKDYCNQIISSWKAEAQNAVKAGSAIIFEILKYILYTQHVYLTRSDTGNHRSEANGNGSNKRTIHAMYVQRNNEARSRNTCCCGKAYFLHISLTVRERESGCGWVYGRWRCVCASVALLNHHATRRHITICCLAGSTTFLDIS